MLNGFLIYFADNQHISPSIQAEDVTYNSITLSIPPWLPEIDVDLHIYFYRLRYKRITVPEDTWKTAADIPHTAEGSITYTATSLEPQTIYIFQALPGVNINGMKYTGDSGPISGHLITGMLYVLNSFDL